MIAEKLGNILIEEGRDAEAIRRVYPRADDESEEKIHRVRQSFNEAVRKAVDGQRDV